MVSDSRPGRYRFDGSRMALVDVPKFDAAGQPMGQQSRPPYVVLTTESIMEERPELEGFRVPREQGYSVWGGDDPDNPTESVYVSFPDEQTFHDLAGPAATPIDPSTMGVTDRAGVGAPMAAAFDRNVFDSEVFETGQVENDVASDSAGEHLGQGTTVAAASGSTSGTSGAVGVGRAIKPSPRDVEKMRGRLRSASWTGIETRIAASPELVAEVSARILELDRLVERCGLTNFEQQKAKALTGALVKLVSSPEPDWDIVVRILNSPGFTALWRLKDIGLLLFAVGAYFVGTGQ